MVSPAEQYAAARRRQADELGPLGRFQQGLGFGLDPFQITACRALAAGRSVLVAAPTGAGKTVVGEFAIHLALAAGRKAFYTTPIKALSNQKYAELVAVHGSDRVGLLTGDTTANGEAEIVVMTTEVLRNMLYAGSPTLAGLGFVVMDEVHYLADRFRGPVWEEVIIHLPPEVKVVSLSATVSNAEEFGDWLDTVRGDTEVVVEEHRPVPLYQHVLIDREIHDLFTSEESAKINPQVQRLAEQARRRDDLSTDRRGRPARGRPGHGGPRRPDVVRLLDDAGLLPAITFVFSRAGCDAAVRQCLDAGIRLTTPSEAEQIRAFAQAQTREIAARDLDVLGYWPWLDGLTRGLAAHHAGLLPSFKEVVEQLFLRGLIRCVFATETLALGINMPARTVVLEKLVKWNGETHADITAGEFTQLTGRAGRRGIDVEGHAVVVWHPGLDPRAVAGLASTRTYPLRSSFRPTYNMAVNLVAQCGRDQARKILETSFAQFQADRGVVGLARTVRTQERALAGYAESMICHLGDFAEYADLRRAVGDREAALSRGKQRARRAEIAETLHDLSRGDIIRAVAARRGQNLVVIEPDRSMDFDGPQPRVMGADRQIRRLSSAQLHEPVTVVGQVRIPKGFNERSAADRRDLAISLSKGAPPESPGPRRRTTIAEDQELLDLRRRLRAHPCHGCAEREDHARWGERWTKLRAETDAVQRRIAGRTSSVARVFDLVCAVLTSLGYLSEHGEVTEDGQRLRRLYSEHDLLVAQCLRVGIWDGLDGPALASCLSALVHESRREGESTSPPPAVVAQAIEATRQQWVRLTEVEADHGLATLREPDAGLALAMHRWARGQNLDVVLRDSDLAAGDFVRRCKQLVDLLGQVSADASPQVQRSARTAMDAIRRGVVAHALPQ